MPGGEAPMLMGFVQMLIARKWDNNIPVHHLFGAPLISYGRQRMPVPEGSRHLLVFVAVRIGWAERCYAAGIQGPTGDDIRAAGNLRSFRWCLNSIGIRLLKTDKYDLAMRHDVLGDLHIVDACAIRLIRGSAPSEDRGMISPGVDVIGLLPGWYDDWELMERERIVQRLLHALETLGRQLAQTGRNAQKVDAAMMAVTAEPLCETAQDALIQMHIGEGNWVEGRRSFEAYRNLLERELRGTQPDPKLASIVRRTVWPSKLAATAASSRIARHPPERMSRASAAGWPIITMKQGCETDQTSLTVCGMHSGGCRIVMRRSQRFRDWLAPRIWQSGKASPRSGEVP
jgi:hypothetical protein